MVIPYIAARAQADRRRLEAMEMWIWKRMEKISRVNKIMRKFYKE